MKKSTLLNTTAGELFSHPKTSVKTKIGEWLDVHLFVVLLSLDRLPAAVEAQYPEDPVGGGEERLSAARPSLGRVSRGDHRTHRRGSDPDAGIHTSRALWLRDDRHFRCTRVCFDAVGGRVARVGMQASVVAACALLGVRRPTGAAVGLGRGRGGRRGGGVRRTCSACVRMRTARYVWRQSSAWHRTPSYLRLERWRAWCALVRG